MKINEKVNRWFRSDDRKQIVDELNEIDTIQGQLLKDKKEWERYRDVKEWREQYGDYWKRIYARKKFLEDVIRRGDSGEPVNTCFSDTSPERIRGKQRGRKRNEDQWDRAYKVMRTQLKEYRHSLLDGEGRIVKSRLFRRVEKDCGISVKTLYNRTSYFPEDIIKLLK
jgi:hypothetical protein